LSRLITKNRKSNHLKIATIGNKPQERFDYLYGENGVLSPSGRNNYEKFQKLFLFMVIENFGSDGIDIFFESLYSVKEEH